MTCDECDNTSVEPDSTGTAKAQVVYWRDIDQATRKPVPRDAVVVNLAFTVCGKLLGDRISECISAVVVQLSKEFTFHKLRIPYHAIVLPPQQG